MVFTGGAATGLIQTRNAFWTYPKDGQKFGGRYLPENKSYALQTIAHNTVTVDGRSNYGGDYDTAVRDVARAVGIWRANESFQILPGGLHLLEAA